jgi:oxalate decarboxylase/phosphoglucose isomerase-like protein (cupin superfamily)
MGRLDQCLLVELPKITDPRGNLTFIEENRHVPFEIKRVFYIYDIPAGQNRGAHAHHKLQQFFVCLSGSFNVNLDDGNQKKIFQLSRPWQGLYIPSLIWAYESNFVHGTICMVLASDLYQETDYYRDYDLFLKAVGEQT